MIEVLKQALERAERKLSAYVGVCTGDKELTDAVLPMVRQAIAELESQEPVAWMHIMDNTEGIKANGAGIVSITQKRKHPFGKVGIDFSKSYLVTSTPLYTHPPQRIWARLTKEQLATTDWSSDFRAGALWAEAKLKEKNS